MKTSLLAPPNAGTLLARLIDSPALVETVQALTPASFSALVRHIGVEDAGEIIALATTEQLVAAFDEDLFVNDRPGERESFDSARFVVWLEVLLEAGDTVAAQRVAELSEDFVARALSSILVVLDHDALLARMGEGGQGAAAADKAIESCLSEDLDGYLLISRDHEGWDAVLALILALDRDHRPFLIRVCDLCAEASSGYIDDLEELATVLSAAESLAEDVEAEREDRRSRHGYVEPRAARSFLALARTPLGSDAASAKRDPITRAYFRDLEPIVGPASVAKMAPDAERLVRTIGAVVSAPVPALPSAAGAESPPDRELPVLAAMRLLSERDPRAFGERMAEFTYLANVLVSGTDNHGDRFRPAEAAEAVLATVDLGAELEVFDKPPASGRASPEELYEVLRACRAEALFRKAGSELVRRGLSVDDAGFLHSREQLEAALEQLRPRARE
ncbi:DUF6178 family protein [Haliangium sp.]|uniref:DUF6178 family protein n=1 Tax=Haliangium sp. TaxID=2663208 RepID=UPI003D10A62D